MAYEIDHLLKYLKVEYSATAPATFELSTDIPGTTVAVRFTQTLTVLNARRVARVVFPDLRGRRMKLRISGPGVMRLFGASVFARPIGIEGTGQWGWYPLPVTETLDAYRAAGLPIRETGEAFRAAGLPIKPTSEEWRAAALPIPSTASLPRWVDLAVDAVE